MAQNLKFKYLSERSQPTPFVSDHEIYSNLYRSQMVTDRRLGEGARCPVCPPWRRLLVYWYKSAFIYCIVIRELFVINTSWDIRVLFRLLTSAKYYVVGICWSKTCASFSRPTASAYFFLENSAVKLFKLAQKKTIKLSQWEAMHLARPTCKCRGRCVFPTCK